MKRQKVHHLNLAEMDENEMLSMMRDNNMDMIELCAILDSLFEMFSASLRFSKVVFQYGYEEHIDFIPTFLQHAVDRHGISPQGLIDIIEASTSRASASVH